MICVLGDSHSRAFAHNSNFFPMFLGAGKEHNFISEENAARVASKIPAVLSHIKSLKEVIFVLGEPDTRYYTGQGWYPWESTLDPDITGYQAKVNSSVTRYETMLKSLQKTIRFEPVIFNVTPSQRILQNVVVDHYNEQLKQMCGSNGYRFIYINDKLYSGDANIIHDKYYGDNVHMNNKIQPLIEEVLTSYGLIETSGYDKEFNWSHAGVMKEFAFDKKFGCYKQVK